MAEAHETLKKYSKDIVFEKTGTKPLASKKERTKTVKKYKDLVKSINKEIKSEEDKKQWESAKGHKRQLENLKLEWKKAEENVHQNSKNFMKDMSVWSRKSK